MHTFHNQSCSTKTCGFSNYGSKIQPSENPFLPTAITHFSYALIILLPLSSQVKPTNHSQPRSQIANHFSVPPPSDAQLLCLPTQTSSHNALQWKNRFATLNGAHKNGNSWYKGSGMGQRSYCLWAEISGNWSDACRELGDTFPPAYWITNISFTSESLFLVATWINSRQRISRT